MQTSEITVQTGKMWPGAAEVPAVDISQGLAVTRHYGGGWHVVHTWCWRNGGTGLPATGQIRYKRDAKTAMAELLATGCDFTASPDDIQTDPAWPAVIEVARRWYPARSSTTAAPGMSPVCYASRNTDGTIHATNAIGMKTGNHHVHADDADFGAWQRSASAFEVKWLDGTTDCTCPGRS